MTTRSTRSTRSRDDAANKKLASQITYRTDRHKNIRTWNILQGEDNMAVAAYVLTVHYDRMTIDNLDAFIYRDTPKNWIAT